MPTPVLATKLYIPSPRPKLVPRPRLIERLNESLLAGQKLTLISASAGFGKTTLVSAWIAGSKRPTAWLSLDEGDNDLTRFLAYLIAALQTIDAAIGNGVLALLYASQPQPAPSEALLTSLLNDIATLPDNIILVLDDYHMIDCEPIDQALTFLLDHLPPQMRVVIATREDPNLPLARLRVRGQLTELRAADLRFTPAEAAEFLNPVMGLNLSAENLAALEAHTEGWIAGLQLAALSMQGREDIGRFIQAFTGSHRFVLDYLVEEVLQHQPEPVRRFLLQTALLDRFCAPLCNAVTERADGQDMLEGLERSNLFLISLDDKRQWYRYHHLFADVLQAHWPEAQADQIAALHLRASAWYEQNGLRPEAISHALVAKDFERAAGLIELAWPAAEAGSIPPATWLGWAKTLPEALVRARPVLSVWYAYAILGNGALEAAESRFQDAERRLARADEYIVTDEEQLKSLTATIAVGRAFIAQALGNIPDTVRYAQRVLELMPEDDQTRHNQATGLLGMAHWASGDLEAASRVFADYTRKLRAAGNIPDAIGTTVVLTDIGLALGHLREAIRTLQQLLQFVMDQGEPIAPDIADLHRGLSELYLEQGDRESAAQHWQRSQELSKKAQLPVLRYRLCMAQARLAETQGNRDEALALLDEAERLYIRTPLPNLRPISALKARLWVAQGRLPPALEWVSEQELSADDDPCYLHEFEHLTLTRILIAQYQRDLMEDVLEAAQRLLERLLQAAEEGHRMGSVIEILVLQALAHQAQGNLPRALAPLERALTLAEPEGYVRLFVNEGAPIAQLLSEAAARGIRPNYVGKLLAAFQTEAPPRPDKPDLPLAQPLVEPLSQRELEILQLIAQGLSNREISERLFLALSTVKGYNQNLFAKLQVQSRTEALARARALGLL